MTDTLVTRRRIRNIAELAQIAGVSAGTVSRALADKNLVNPETKARIQALAHEYDFRPNLMARRLRTRQTGVIGMIPPVGADGQRHMSDPQFMALLGPVADALAARSYDLMISRVSNDGGNWLQHLADSGTVDGLILVGQTGQGAAIDRVAHPLVQWGVDQKRHGLASVGGDDSAGGALAARHMLDSGARRIAFLGEAKSPDVAARLAGCRSALTKAAGIDDLTTLTTTAELGAHFGDGKRAFDSIIAASDDLALRAIRALADLGLSVPGDVRVMGFGDASFGKHSIPRLTTIGQDMALAAVHLVDMLFARINGAVTAPLVLPPRLIIRESA